MKSIDSKWMPGAPNDFSANSPIALRGETVTWGICTPSVAITLENETVFWFFPSETTYE